MAAMPNSPNPAMSPHIPGTRHTDKTVEGRKIGMGVGGKMLNEQLHRPLHKRLTKNSQILAVYKATRTMWACTYGIDGWMPAKLVGRLTAKLVDRLTA